jgi:hypothetical protein
VPQRQLTGSLVRAGFVAVEIRRQLVAPGDGADAPSNRLENTMTTLIRHARRTRRAFARAGVVLFGAALLAGGTAGVAQAGSVDNAALATTTLPTGEAHVMANKGPLLSLQAGSPDNGHASVFEAFENPTQATPDNMRFVALPFDGNKMFVVCSKTVSASLGGPFGLACLDVTGKSSLPGTSLKIAPFDNTTSQRWIIENKDPVRPQTLTMRNVASGLYIDSGDNPASGDRPTQRPFKQGPSQQWFIKAAKQ